MTAPRSQNDVRLEIHMQGLSPLPKRRSLREWLDDARWDKRESGRDRRYDRDTPYHYRIPTIW